VRKIYRVPLRGGRRCGSEERPPPRLVLAATRARNGAASVVPGAPMEEFAMKTLAAFSAAAFSAALASGAAPSAAQEGGRPFTVQMTGAAERPGPGDPDGTGTATFRVNPGQERICYTLTVADIEPATAAHIHIAPPSDAGPIVVPLEAPTDGSSEGCAPVSRALALEIIRNPGAYYVNVHNAPYPRGAVRGQLSR
jgi:hypothetical protein